MAHRDVSVNWVAKAFAFNVFQRIPRGEQVYYFFQRSITKTLPRSLSPTAISARAQVAHAQAIVAARTDIATLTLLELGAGWDLYANLVYWCYGINNQIAIDIRRWARAETVNAVISHLHADPPPGRARLPIELVRDSHFDDDLKRIYGIRYLAPYDASSTDLDDASVDIITTTSVFEHVPEPICAAILRECRRILAPGGMMRHTIDYSDHYAHADPSISSYNYLRFGNSVWALFNPDIHYQNRLRSPDFRRLFHQADLHVEDEIAWHGDAAELDRIKVHPQFAKYDETALRTLGATFALRPA